VAVPGRGRRESRGARLTQWRGARPMEVSRNGDRTHLAMRASACARVSGKAVLGIVSPAATSGGAHCGTSKHASSAVYADVRGMDALRRVSWKR